MIKNITEKVLSIYYNFLLKYRKPYQYIHLLSHPRSGSTLLSHILLSHPDITGFGESKLVYSKSKDIKKLPILVALKLHNFPFLGNETYVLDKLVHNWLITAENVSSIYNQHTYIIFLLREPKPTLNSMSRLHWIRTKDNPKEYVVEWYINRIQVIQKYCQQLKKSRYRYLAVLTYKQILYDTKKVFEMLENFLQLDYPLSEKYKVLRTTGRWGTGDSSKYIKSGKIIKHREQKYPSDIDLHDQMDMINKVYQDCYLELSQNCHSIE